MIWDNILSATEMPVKIPLIIGRLDLEQASDVLNSDTLLLSQEEVMDSIYQ